MKILSLDLSTKTGYAILEGPKLLEFGKISHGIPNFNVNDYPNRQPEYPFNIINSAKAIAKDLAKLCQNRAINKIVIENTVRGRNRNTQRALEFIHYAVLEELKSYDIVYLDPSEWRALIGLRFSKEDKDHNKLVKSKKARGKITAKHLSVRFANNLYKKDFKVKDNDVCDAICLGVAYIATFS